MSEPEPRANTRSWLERVVDRLSGEPSDRQQLMHGLRAAADKQILSNDELNILLGAIQVSDMQARDILIPMSQVVSVRVDQDPADILPLIIESKHSRFPVLGADDRVVGILHAKDMLSLASAQPKNLAVRDCIRPATAIPESKRLNTLLQEFRVNRNHMAVVVNEYGEAAGIITIEDVLEQIVGDIEDEHDVGDELLIKQLDDNSFTINARTPIEEFNSKFATQFSDEEFDTIGGIVLSRFGHMPERDESLEIEGLRFTVLNADSRRIRLLHLSTQLAE